MRTTQYTPGSWKHLVHEVDGVPTHVVEIGPPSWVPVRPDGVTDQEIAANCALISAAPDLLDAAKSMLRALESLARECQIGADPMIIAARAAIAKACGD